MSRDRATTFSSWAWTAALILALAAAACSRQSPPVTTVKAPPPAPAPQAAPPTQTAPLTQTAPPKPGEPVAPASPAPAKAGKPFTEDELAALLAPIALYPDNVVAQILMGSTYPIEVLEANRWLQTNKLQGEELAAAVQKQEWEDSVKALVAAPEVLKMLDENLPWMQKIGDAFLAQQKDVFDMVQTLRAKAIQEGTLKSDEHMKVSMTPATPPEEATTTTTTETTEITGEKPQQIIAIESADPEVIYVPTYSPESMYGYWGYGYPPYYWPPPYGYPGSGFWWGVGAGIIAGGIWGDCCWGGGDVDIDWDGGDINIDRGDRVEHRRGEGGDRGQRGDRPAATDRSRTGQGGEKWSHSPEHRRGASYRDNATASKFNRGSAGAGSREGFRGRAGGTAGSASRPGAGTRPSTGTTGSRSRGSSGSSSAFGGMGSGSRAGSYGSRGGMSRGGGGGGMRGGGGRRR